MSLCIHCREALLKVGYHVHIEVETEAMPELIRNEFGVDARFPRQTRV
jgi:hypothetical protein